MISTTVPVQIVMLSMTTPRDKGLAAAGFIAVANYTLPDTEFLYPILYLYSYIIKVKDNYFNLILMSIKEVDQIGGLKIT